MSLWPQDADRPSPPAPWLPVSGSSPAFDPPPDEPRSRKLPWIVGGVTALVLLGLGGTTIAAMGSDRPVETVAAPSAPSIDEAPTPTPPPTTAAAAARPATKPATTTATTRPTKAPAKAKPSAYRKLTVRDWQLITKNPPGHAGRKIVIYGVVTQFDAATGVELFRADAGPADSGGDADTNTVFTGNETTLADLVEGDEFHANAVVVGAISYETEDGGVTTAPKLRIVSIRIA